MSQFAADGIEDGVDRSNEIEEDDGSPGGAFFEPRISCVSKLEIWKRESNTRLHHSQHDEGQRGSLFTVVDLPSHAIFHKFKQ